MCQSMHVATSHMEIRGRLIGFVGSFLPTMWVLGITLRSAGWMAGAFTCWAIFPTLDLVGFILFNVRELLCMCVGMRGWLWMTSLIKRLGTVTWCHARLFMWMMDLMLILGTSTLLTEPLLLSTSGFKTTFSKIMSYISVYATAKYGDCWQTWPSSLMRAVEFFLPFAIL